MDNLAPIVLFVYNRPDHTRQTVEALQNNVLADQSELFIYADNAKNELAKENVEKVREYIRTIKGFKSIAIIERDKNWGLADSIIDGVTTVVNKFGKIIVLEDDIVTSKYFLQYMNDALIKYENEKKVMEITGYSFPMEKEGLPESFFSRVEGCWSWATWQDRWQLYKRDEDALIIDFSEQDIYELNCENTHDFWEQVLQNKKGKIRSWAIFWYAAIFKNKGLVLSPKLAMARNCGMDNTGVHCGVTNVFDVEIYNKPITEFPNEIVEHKQAYENCKDFFVSIKPNIMIRIINRFKRIFK